MYVPPPSVSFSSRCPHRFRVTPLSRIARWFREVGYTVPILSNDRRFDERWSLQTCDREFGAALLHERETRDAIQKLAELDCVGIGHSGRKLTAVLRRRLRARDHGPEQRQGVRDQLEVMDGVLTRMCGRRNYAREGGSGRCITAVVILGLALIAGVIALAAHADELIDGELGPLALLSLLFSVPLALGVSLAMALLLAGRSTSHQELGVVLALAFTGLTALGVGTALFINGTLDDGIATVHRVPLVDVQLRHGETSKHTLFAIVPDWNTARGDTLRIKVRREREAELVPGTTWLQLTTSPGKLGAERLLDLRVEGAENR